MTLMGHSLGGYAASAYTIAHPERVERLILLSPLGIPEKPADDPAALAQRSWKQRAFFGLINQMWQNGLTPQGAVKIAGPRGKSFIDKYVNSRFRQEEINLEQDLKEEEDERIRSEMNHAMPRHKSAVAHHDSHSDTMSAEQIEHRSEAMMSVMPLNGASAGIDKEAGSNYLYQSFCAPSSGEFALAVMLHQGAFAKLPFANRLPPVLAKHNIKTALVYGTSDWVSPDAGAQLARDTLKLQPYTAKCIKVMRCEHQLQIESRKGTAEAVAFATFFDRTV